LHRRHQHPLAATPPNRPTALDPPGAEDGTVAQSAPEGMPPDGAVAPADAVLLADCVGALEASPGSCNAVSGLVDEGALTAAEPPAWLAVAAPVVPPVTAPTDSPCGDTVV
jgi:hypothetical protein